MKRFPRLWLLWMLLVVLTIGGEIPGYAKDPALDSIALFAQAGFSYKRGDYQDALVKYEQIIQDGFTSGAIYYNLGNCYVKTGRMGKAILNYERARRLMPRDSDLKANHAYALSLIENGQLKTRVSWPRGIFTRYGENFTVDELTLISFLLLVSMGVLYLGGLYGGWPRKNIYILLIVGAIFFVGNTTALFLKALSEQNSAVVTTATRSQFEPLENATTHFELPEGEKVTILKKEGQWYKIRRGDGKEGWSRVEALEKI